MLLPRSLRSQNRISVFLITYCILVLYYLGLFSQSPDDPYEVFEEIKPTQIKEVVSKTRLNTESSSKISTPIAFNIQQEKIEDVSPEDRYEHLLNPEFPLSGALKSPKPRHRLGNLTKKADMVIGITTVKRENGDYLLNTIDSLLQNREGNQSTIQIVVFVGETNLTYVQGRSKQIYDKFKDKINVGEIEVISPPESYYPNWDIAIEVTLNDTLDRVKWRSKQNLDQIFIMMYVYHFHPTYYLMMEDDVISKKGYDKKIFEAAKNRRGSKWFFISFCGLGAIGKLFETTTLPSYASFIHTFWNKKPLDWLQMDYVESAYCSHETERKICIRTRRSKMPAVLPSLFQHVGKYSSLKGKIQALKDKSFNRTAKVKPTKP